MRISDWNSDVCSSDLSWVYNLRRFQMSNDDYLPEDHEAAKAVFAEKGPLGLVASRGFSSQNSCSASRSGGYLRSEEHTSELQSLMRISYAVFCLNKKTQATL